MTEDKLIEAVARKKFGIVQEVEVTAEERDEVHRNIRAFFSVMRRRKAISAAASLIVPSLDSLHRSQTMGASARLASGKR